MAFREKMESSRGIISVIVLIAVGILIAWGMFGTNMKAEADHLKITGLHMQKIPYSEIAEYKLIEKLPNITARTGGFSMAGKRIGNFTTSEYGVIKLFLFNNSSPFIFIEKTDGKIVILNMKEPVDTRGLYDELAVKIQ
ncbi:MAG: PH domain-containing protein [Clostridia bacterium]|nr:PH domain-containing protein [Clostridia bacterium]